MINSQIAWIKYKGMKPGRWIKYSWNQKIKKQKRFFFLEQIYNSWSDLLYEKSCLQSKTVHSPATKRNMSVKMWTPPN